MKIAFIGKFTKIHDEEYIAQSFEMLGHEVKRIPNHTQTRDIGTTLESFRPDILLYLKWECPRELLPIIAKLKREYTFHTVCWLFDLYFDYHREYQVKTRSYFKSDYVFTSDGGHKERFLDLGINHQCVRQGIYKNECYVENLQPVSHEVVFVGSDNPIYPERKKILDNLDLRYIFKWYGKKNTDEVRGRELNELYAKSLIIVGDSFYSPHYWSNRVVETLGRGGFLIHQEVPGIKEEYPYLVTYKRGDIVDLQEKINFYLTHEKQRVEVIHKNFEWVRDNYTMEKKCAELLSKL